jgi:DNA invertase Pin-like site-specific DNA recombinase
MAVYGYARVSTTDQDVTLQIETLKAAGCMVVRAEKVSGTSRNGRTELQVLFDFLQPGDVLMVSRIDRLARSVKDLQDIVHELRAKGVTLKATEQPIDTGTAAGKAFLDMLGVFAEFETILRRERQLEGIAKAKAEGAYKGGKRRLDRETVRAMFVAGQGPPPSPRPSGARGCRSIGCWARALRRKLISRFLQHLGQTSSHRVFGQAHRTLHWEVVS